MPCPNALHAHPNQPRTVRCEASESRSLLSESKARDTNTAGIGAQARIRGGQSCISLIHHVGPGAGSSPAWLSSLCSSHHFNRQPKPEKKLTERP